MHTASAESLYNRFSRFRAANAAVLEKLDEAHCEIIPRGLRNNLRWQAGHLVTVQASLLYLRCGVEPPLARVWFDSFAKGTSPVNWTSDTPSFAETLSQLKAMVERTHRDLPKLTDLRYGEPITVTGSETLTNFVDALSFLALHEALHLGTINTMRRLLP